MDFRSCILLTLVCLLSLQDMILASKHKDVEKTYHSSHNSSHHSSHHTGTWHSKEKTPTSKDKIPTSNHKVPTSNHKMPTSEDKKTPRDSRECHDCEWDISSPLANMQCFDSPSSVRKSRCDMDSPYCRTQLTFENDVITNLVRGCTNGILDLDQSTSFMPTHEKCYTDFEEYLNGTETTICHLSCQEDACNTQILNSIILCKVYCGLNGKCNYSSGECACHEEFYGERCENRIPRSVPFRQCIQCDSETNTNCHFYNESSPCPSIAHKYCSTVSVTRYNEAGNETRHFLAKSCTESYEVADECFITNDDDINEIESTCISTCDTDGCNHYLPNGFAEGSAGNETQPLQCVICDSDNDGLTNCAHKTTTDYCPSTATHCYSTVSYYLSEIKDVPYEVEPNYLLDTVIRGCADWKMDTNCTEAKFGDSSLKKYNCTEGCSEDGCNTGWPARPKCSQCACSLCTYEDACSNNPPIPTDCSKPYHEYCTIEDVDRFVAADPMNNAYPRILTRGCSYKSIGDNCGKSQYTVVERKLESCNKSCTTDGCNLGYFPYTPKLFYDTGDSSKCSAASATYPYIFFTLLSFVAAIFGVL